MKRSYFSPPGISLILGILLGACTIQLAPAFDKDLNTKLNETHEKTLVLFSALSACPSDCAFSKHSATYDEIIGAYAALQDRAEARPAPALAVRLSRSKAFSKVCANATPEACLNTTPEKLDLVSQTLSDMRDTHRASVLNRGSVELFTIDYTASIQPTLIIEAALKR